MLKSLADLHNTNFMLVDTVKLWTDSYDVTGGKLSRHANQTGSPSRCSYPYFFDKLAGWTAKMSRGRLWLEGSIPRLFHRLNFHYAHYNEISTVTDYLRKLGEKLGIAFNCSSLKISRADFFLNKRLDFPVCLFIKQLSNILKYNRMIQVAARDYYNLTYIRWSNKRRQLAIYDKTEDMNHKGMRLDANWLRAEVRLMNTEINREYDIYNLHGLMDVKKQLFVWKSECRRLIRGAKSKGFFDRSDNCMSRDIVEEVERCIGAGNDVRNLLRLIASFGIYLFFDHFQGMDGFQRLLQSSVTTTRRDRILNQINKVIEYRNRFGSKPRDLDVWTSFESWVESA